MASLFSLFVNDRYKTSAKSRQQTAAAKASQASDTRARQRAAQQRANQAAAAAAARASSTPSQTSNNSSASSSSGSGITTLGDASGDASGGDASGEGGTGEGGSSSVSPLLKGEMSFEELVGEICNGIDLIFLVKRSTVVVTDYEGIYAEAKYLRDKNHKVVKGEDINLWQIEEGTYELDVNEYGFYNTVIVVYKNGSVKESYEDLVRVYSEVPITYVEKDLDKTSAIMKAKAYLAAHVRDFEMSLKANVLWNGDIDIGDIVTIDNPLTLRDKYRVEQEKRDPEYYFVLGKSVEWEGDTPITGTLELRYGAVSPEKKDVPETGAQYSGSSSKNVTEAIAEVASMYKDFGYCHTCQTAECAKQHKCGDCWGMSDLLACELQSKGVSTKIVQYAAIASNHRSVLYQDSDGTWKDFPYREYGFNQLFNNTSGSKNGTEVSKTC